MGQFKNMKRQIVVIHGGTTFNTRKEYISYLKNREVSIEKFKLQKDWKDALEKELGEDFEVLAPQMPNKTNAHYEEWKIWFERMVPFLNNNVVFIGNSLGGIFLAKYLSENLFPNKIKATLLIAAPFDDKDMKESLTDFILPSSLKKLTVQSGKIYLIYSEDDPVVPFNHLNKYKNNLPDAEIIIFTDRKHFTQETFSEIIKLIKNL